VGRAETALPALRKEAEATKGWHQWLWITRVSRAEAEVALAAGRFEEAVERSLAAIALAERYHRLKYAATSRLALGRARVELGMAADGTEDLRRALAEAEELGSPPVVWQAAATLARALYAVGDDAGAEAARAQAQATVDEFAATLSEQRRQQFLQAPLLADLLAVTR
jgi:hypothetical protein